MYSNNYALLPSEPDHKPIHSVINNVFTLQAIRKNHTVLADYFTAMLEEWFKSSPNPTWSVLVDALRSSLVGCSGIAYEIEDKYIKSDDSSLQENKDSISEW